VSAKATFATTAATATSGCRSWRGPSATGPVHGKGEQRLPGESWSRFRRGRRERSRPLRRAPTVGSEGRAPEQAADGDRDRENGALDARLRRLSAKEEGPPPRTLRPVRLHTSGFSRRAARAIRTAATIAPVISNAAWTSNAVSDVARPLRQPARAVPLPDRQLLRVDERARIPASPPEVDLDRRCGGQRRTSATARGSLPRAHEEERDRDQKARWPGQRRQAPRARQRGTASREPSAAAQAAAASARNVRVGEQQHERARPAGERGAPSDGSARIGFEAATPRKRQAAGHDHDREGGGPVGDRP